MELFAPFLTIYSDVVTPEYRVVIGPPTSRVLAGEHSSFEAFGTSPPGRGPHGLLHARSQRSPYPGAMGHFVSDPEEPGREGVPCGFLAPRHPPGRPALDLPRSFEEGPMTETASGERPNAHRAVVPRLAKEGARRRSGVSVRGR